MFSFILFALCFGLVSAACPGGAVLDKETPCHIDTDCRLPTPANCVGASVVDGVNITGVCCPAPPVVPGTNATTTIMPTTVTNTTTNATTPVTTTAIPWVVIDLPAKKTIKTTIPATALCVDRLNPRTGVSDCPATAHLCTDPVYFDVMTLQCPKTCNRCSTGTETGSSTTCVDKVNSAGISECPGKKAYCTDPAYTSFMKTECPKTCGFCTN